MKCGNCGQDILQVHPEICPYCKSKNLISDEDETKEIREIERLQKARRYEEAALKYEKLDQWDKAKDCRKIAKKKQGKSGNLEIGKVGTINVLCPHCNASQPVTSKSGEETCHHCGTTYIVPTEIRHVLGFDGKS
jgi:hypothetical protein